jgi:hypothetical protein
MQRNASTIKATMLIISTADLARLEVKCFRVTLIWKGLMQRFLLNQPAAAKL